MGSIGFGELVIIAVIALVNLAVIVAIVVAVKRSRALPRG
jgi:hypothetical protein